MRVLVVEDERRLAAAVRRGLQAEGFAVDLAHDGVDGLHMAREGAYAQIRMPSGEVRRVDLRCMASVHSREHWWQHLSYAMTHLRS